MLCIAFTNLSNDSCQLCVCLSFLFVCLFFSTRLLWGLIFITRGTKTRWVHPWSVFGGLLRVTNYQCKKEELGVIVSKIYNLNWFHGYNIE